MLPEKNIRPGTYIPQLDGLRGIAVLMVMCYHYFPGNIFCNFGWTGVDLFFVLSGFLITSRLLPFLNDKKILRKFYTNRFLRIVPLYFLFLVIFFSGWFILSSKETLATFKFYNDHWWQFFLFIQNWVFANNLFESKTYVEHLWSVAVEEQIYLFFPLLLIFIRNTTKAFYVILFIFLFVIISRWYYFLFIISREVYLKIFYNTFFRLDSFLAGVLIYFIYIKHKKFNKAKVFIKWTALICFLIMFSYILFTKDIEKNNPFIAGGGYTIIALMYAGLLLVTLSKNNKIIDSIASSRFLRYTGKISYGMYIIHWPLYLTGFILLNKAFNFLHLSPDNTSIHALNILISIPLTYLISYLSFRYYESYFLRRKVRSV